MVGRLVDQKEIATQVGNQTLRYNAPQLAKGMYVYMIIDDRQQSMHGRFIIK